jgi:hypothetical protein
LIAALITPAGTASAFCDAADCVPNVTRNVVEGAPCVPQPVYDFGLDSNSRTFVCATTGAWLPAGSLVGLRAVALPCDAVNESAQDANGIPLFCAQINGGLRWAHRVDTPGPAAVRQRGIWMSFRTGLSPVVRKGKRHAIRFTGSV